MVAQVTFRSDNVFTDRFGRELADKAPVGDTLDMWQRFEVERYLEYHGEKLARRFDTNSYLAIGKAMDLHDVGTRSRNGSIAAMRRGHGADADDRASGATCSTRRTSSGRSTHAAQPNGVPSEYVEIDSPHGHDAFLINSDQLDEPIERFIAAVAKSDT